MRALLTVPIALALVACQQKAETLRIVDPSIRLAANPANPAALYFTVVGGAEADRLLSVTTQVNTRSELHESMKHEGMMTMRPLAGVHVPAGGRVAFEPGGKHVMLYGVQADIKPPVLVNTEFSFASGTRLSVMVPTRSAGGQ